MAATAGHPRPRWARPSAAGRQLTACSRGRQQQQQLLAGMERGQAQSTSRKRSAAGRVRTSNQYMLWCCPLMGQCRCAAEKVAAVLMQPSSVLPVEGKSLRQQRLVLQSEECSGWYMRMTQLTAQGPLPGSGGQHKAARVTAQGHRLAPVVTRSRFSALCSKAKARARWQRGGRAAEGVGATR